MWTEVDEKEIAIEHESSALCGTDRVRGIFDACLVVVGYD